MDIGEERKEIIVVPLEAPAPVEQPEPREVPAEPAKEPAGV